MLPDVERLTSSWLRAQAAVTTLVGQRVYTAVPNEPTFPLVLLSRFSGAPVIDEPLYFDRAALQFSAYADTKVLAHTIARTVCDELAEESFRTTAHDEGIVTGVLFGAFQWLPDSTYARPKPRYVFDVQIFTHP